MFTREIQAPRDTPIENGLPVQGTWNRAFKEVNLLDILRPYRFPVFRWARAYRIKEWQSFTVQDDKYFLGAMLADLKLYCMAQVRLYNKETGDFFRFRKLLPGSIWRLPRSLANASAGSRSKRFFFLVHNWLDADAIKLDLDIAAHKGQPALTVHLDYNMSIGDVTPMAVSLCFSETRSMYAFKAAAAVWGDIVLGDKRINMDRARTTGIFCDCKGFFPYRMRSISCSAMGFTGDGRRLGFHLTKSQAKETNRNNENAMWIDGRLIPLPPVRITMPKGVNAGWIIQDVEGMVDLVFTPKAYDYSSGASLFFSAEYNSPLGYYDGMLADSDGEQIQVHNMWGLGENLFLRM